MNKSMRIYGLRIILTNNFHNRRRQIPSTTIHSEQFKDWHSFELVWWTQISIRTWFVLPKIKESNVSNKHRIKQTSLLPTLSDITRLNFQHSYIVFVNRAHNYNRIRFENAFHLWDWMGINVGFVIFFPLIFGCNSSFFSSPEVCSLLAFYFYSFLLLSVCLLFSFR